MVVKIIQKHDPLTWECDHLEFFLSKDDHVVFHLQDILKTLGASQKSIYDFKSNYLVKNENAQGAEIEFFGEISLLINGREKRILFKQEKEIFLDQVFSEKSDPLQLKFLYKAHFKEWERTILSDFLTFTPSLWDKAYLKAVQFYHYFTELFDITFSTSNLKTKKIVQFAFSDQKIIQLMKEHRSIASTFPQIAPFEVSILNKIMGLIKKMPIFQESSKLKAYTAVSADWLCEIAEKTETTTIIDNLLQNNSFHCGVKNFAQAYHVCKNRYYNGPQFPPFQVRETLVKERLIEIEKLTTDECVLLNIPFAGHSLAAMIKKENNGSYSFYLANTGMGIEAWHPSKMIEDGSIKYKTLMKIDHITHMGNIENFLARLHRPPVLRQDELYGVFIPLLGGKINEDDNPAFWSHGQVNGSCTASSELALLRAIYPKKEYQKIINLLRNEALFKIYHRISSGWEWDETAKIVGLDIIKKLSKRGPLSETMAPIARALQTSKAPTVHSKSPRDWKLINPLESPDKIPSWVGTLSSLQAFYLHFSQGRHEMAYSWLVHATNTPQLSLQLNTHEQAKLKKMVLKVISRSKDDHRLDVSNMKAGFLLLVDKYINENHITIKELPTFAWDTMFFYLQGGLVSQYPQAPWIKNIHAYLKKHKQLFDEHPSIHDLPIAQRNDYEMDVSGQLFPKDKDDLKKNLFLLDFLMKDKRAKSANQSINHIITIIQRRIKEEAPFNLEETIKMFDFLNSLKLKEAELRSGGRLQTKIINRRCGFAMIYFEFLKLQRSHPDREIIEQCQKEINSPLAVHFRTSKDMYAKYHLDYYFPNEIWSQQNHAMSQG